MLSHHHLQVQDLNNNIKIKKWGALPPFFYFKTYKKTPFQPLVNQDVFFV